MRFKLVDIQALPEILFAFHCRFIRKKIMFVSPLVALAKSVYVGGLV
jgi:hypothetical protein